MYAGGVGIIFCGWFPLVVRSADATKWCGNYLAAGWFPLVVHSVSVQQGGVGCGVTAHGWFP